MILGIGIDIVKSDRVRDAIARHGNRFIERIFTFGEIAYCDRKNDPTESQAARFAVKEAVFKALGCGWSDSGGFSSVEIVNDRSGKPVVVLHGRTKEIAEEHGVERIHVSITHDAGVSAAMVVLEGSLASC